MTEAREQTQGRLLIERLRSILRRCEAAGEQVNLPGEGGERRFRLWLATSFLMDTLGWPETSVIQGERFDLTLRDDSGHPVVTIETKTPYHTASQKERRDFENRLAAFPTLRYAIFTSGDAWERYVIENPLGTPTILQDAHFELGSVNPLTAASFFAPIRYRGKIHLPEGYRYKVSKGEPFIQTALLRLTSDLEASIAELIAFFNGLFHGLREGFAGRDAQNYLDTLYAHWSRESLRITPHKLAETVADTIRTEGATFQSIADCLKSFGFEGTTPQQVTETILSLSDRARSSSEAIAKALWPLFEPYVRQLCAQTAHIQIARVLLYRVGEDEGVFDLRLNGEPLKRILSAAPQSVLGRTFPATEALEAVRSRMQSFLPSIYALSEFDWWMVKPEYRPGLTAAQQSWLLPRDEEFELINNAILQRLSRFNFRAVDVDIWRNLYENYLPPEERQRLGGFYTPDALVNLVLDLAGYTSQSEGLCKLSFIDPACGSGAFVTTALGRLLSHLAIPMPCHSELHKRNQTEIQKLENTLRIAAGNTHGIDLHPFAAFLTTLNVLFALLNLYVRARKDHPEFTLELNVFAWDSLEPVSREEQPKEQLAMFTQMNSRSQRAEIDFDRYKNAIHGRFDRVFGNPPWGGVLKGALAPVYDTKKKQTFKVAYRNAAQGKYDVYGLFMERALQILKVDGQFALITQGTYLEKEWAAGLRALLAYHSTVNGIVDLNPFGQLFFRAMNAPCITVATKGDPLSTANCVAVVSQRNPSLPDKSTAEKQLFVAETVKGVYTSAEASTSKELKSFAAGGTIAQVELQATAASRWNLSPDRSETQIAEGCYTAAELLEIRQGVTPGNALDIFLLDKSVCDQLRLEAALARRAIKSKDLERWSVSWHRKVLLYPYRKRGKNYIPAFRIELERIRDKKLAKHFAQLGLEDALDFDVLIDDRERELVRRSGVNSDSIPKLLQHRTALGIVRFPNAAKYLVQHYEQLFNRVFEKKRFTKLGKRWYEYHRPREAKIVLAKEKILSPRLIRHARFALDTARFISDDACLFLQPTAKTSEAWSRFSQQMDTCLGKKATPRDLLTYCLCFLNSSAASRALTEGRQPTPKGSYQVTEQSLREIPIPPPSDRQSVCNLLGLGAQIIDAEGAFAAEKTNRLELEIEAITSRALGESNRA